MCTVTYLSNDEGYILTSNRDENPDRPRAEKPDYYNPRVPNVLFPRDPQGSGSWIAFDKNGSARCLLNGAYEVHHPTPPYRHSRGLVTTESFNYPTAEDFYQNYPTENLEPFTLIWIDSEGLYELRWDGDILHFHSLDPLKNQIWSSATLYSEEVRLKRERWFKKWQEGQEIIDQDKILYFHRFGGTGNSAEDLVMKKPGLIPQTISITSFSSGREAKNLIYEDLMTQERIEMRL